MLLLVSIAPFFILDQYCSDEPNNGLADNRSKYSRPGEQRSNQQENSPFAGFPIGPRSESARVEQKGPNTQADAGGQESDWGRTFVCEVSAFDYAIAVFTFFLMTSTAFLWLETRRLAQLAEQQSADAKEALRIAHEDMVVSARSWVYAQPWPGTAVRDTDGNFLVVMEIAFYGRAPALVTGLHVETASAVPDGDPAYSLDRCINMSLALAPGNKPWKQRMPSGAPFKTSPDKPFIWGYVQYQNQFGSFRSRYCAELVYLGKHEVTGGDIFTIRTAGGPAWSWLDQKE